MQQSETNKLDVLIKSLNISQIEFSKALGVTTNAVTNWKKRELGRSVINKIVTSYPQVNPMWLMTGEGEMFREPTAAEMIMSRPKTINLGQSSTDIIVGTTGVPYYNVDFQLGFDPMMIDNRSYADGMFDIALYNNCTCWCNARGDSMKPTIESGDLVALKRIEDLSLLINNEIYAIITKNDLRTIKRIKDNGDTITLIPDNEKYDEQVIPKDAIMHIFEVKGTLKRF